MTSTMAIKATTKASKLTLAREDTAANKGVTIKAATASMDTEAIMPMDMTATITPMATAARDISVVGRRQRGFPRKTALHMDIMVISTPADLNLMQGVIRTAVSVIQATARATGPAAAMDLVVTTDRQVVATRSSPSDIVAMPMDTETAVRLTTAVEMEAATQPTAQVRRPKDT